MGAYVCLPLQPSPTVTAVAQLEEAENHLERFTSHLECHLIASRDDLLLARKEPNREIRDIRVRGAYELYQLAHRRYKRHYQTMIGLRAQIMAVRDIPIVKMAVDALRSGSREMDQTQLDQLAEQLDRVYTQSMELMDVSMPQTDIDEIHEELAALDISDIEERIRLLESIPQPPTAEPEFTAQAPSIESMTRELAAAN